MYTWDGENRLVAIQPPVLHVGDQKVEFVYDYLGRRIEKKRFTVPDDLPIGWDLVEHRKFVWSGWLLLLEVDCSTDLPPTVSSSSVAALPSTGVVSSVLPVSAGVFWPPPAPDGKVVPPT